jgi:transcriptional regulator with XRE-family HTH domain
MNAINTYPSTWFKPISVTGASQAIVSLVVAAALVSPTGTGSLNDALLLKDKLAHANRSWEHVAQPKIENYARSVTEDLSRIREFFSPSVSDLAATLGVSRQTVYNWQNGEQPKEALAEKLNDLARAADVFAQSGIQFSSTLARRKFANGKTLFQVVETNDSATDAAKLLVRILETEARQRSVLEARFASRPKTAHSSDFDLPLANDPA